MNNLIKEIYDTVPPTNSICIWWIGQAGYVIKAQTLTILIDPYLSTYAERITKGSPNEHIRITAPPMKSEDITIADIVLCTHDHADHIDPDSIPVIAQSSPQAHFVVPMCAHHRMCDFGIEAGRIHTLKGDDRLKLSGISVYGIPAKHEQFNKEERYGFPFLSYVIKVEGMTLLHTGDTIPYDGQVERIKTHKIDLAFVPINGRDEIRHRLEFEGNFTCEEAVEFTLDIDAGLTIPMHYDMFTLNTADVKDFIRVAEKRELRYMVMHVGKKLTFPIEN